MAARFGVWLVALGVALLAAPLVSQSPAGGERPPAQASPGSTDQHPVFKSGVDLVHVTVTVTDPAGHFVRGLGRDDFTVSEDGRAQTIVQFTADRAPVSLGIALDTSSSMVGPRLREARDALRRVLDDLLASDEVFLYTFGDGPRLRQAWTTDHQAIERALDTVEADGRTALYDTVDQALRLMESGRYRKKVLLIVSDGNDTASYTPLSGLRDRIRESETLVYAIAVDADNQWLFDGSRRSRPPVRRQIRRPFPPRPPTGGFPPGPGRPPWNPPRPPTPQQPPAPQSDAANVAALRELTDISGGRTEVVRSDRDLGPATASVADELRQQYQLLYQSTSKRDGRWHAIEVTVRDSSFRVRARRGYVAASD